jgi:hypothetical protein
MMQKHEVAVLEHEDGSGTYHGCKKCGMDMGLIPSGDMVKYADNPMYFIYGEDGECPGKPIGDVTIRGFQEFWISPNHGGDIRDSIRRLYGGSGFLTEMEKVTQEEFEADYGPCLGIQIWERGDLVAVTEKYIVTVGEYDGSEYLDAVERTPEWFSELEDSDGQG